MKEAGKGGRGGGGGGFLALQSRQCQINGFYKEHCRKTVPYHANCFCVPNDFLEAWGAKDEQPHTFQKHGFLLASPLSAARLWCPRLPQTQLAKTTFRDLFDRPIGAF